MRREGTLHIVWMNHGRGREPKYNVGFSDYASAQVATQHREIVGEVTLGHYLAEQVKVHPDAVHLTLKRLKIVGNAAIFHTVLSDEELVNLGLK